MLSNIGVYIYISLRNSNYIFLHDKEAQYFFVHRCTQKLVFLRMLNWSFQFKKNAFFYLFPFFPLAKSIFATIILHQPVNLYGLRMSNRFWLYDYGLSNSIQNFKDPAEISKKHTAFDRILIEIKYITNQHLLHLELK